MNKIRPVPGFDDMYGTSETWNVAKPARSGDGAIQPSAALLIIDPKQSTIIGHSDNLGTVFENAPCCLRETPLARLSAELATEIAALCPDSQVSHELLNFRPTHHGIVHDAVTHLEQGMRVVEFLPNTRKAMKTPRQKRNSCSTSCAQILHAEEFTEALKIAVDSLRKITGFARVKTYRLQPNGSYEVLAQSSDRSMPPHQGVHFPASEVLQHISKANSALPGHAIGNMGHNASKFVFDPTHKARPSMTLSVTKSISAVYATYLRIMGINAAFYARLKHKGELWGMIAIHDSAPDLLPFEDWSLVQEIGAALMLRYEQQEYLKSAATTLQLRQMERQFSSAIGQSTSVQDAICDLLPSLDRVLSADGFAFQHKEKIHVTGLTPPPAFIRQMVAWATKNRSGNETVYSRQLHQQWPQAADHLETACGVLIQPLQFDPSCHLIWFRRPLDRTIGSAEDAYQLLSEAPKNPMNPESTNEMIFQFPKDQCAPWDLTELENARQIFSQYGDLLKNQHVLEDENAALRRFAEAAVHDIKAPLRGIKMALDIMAEEDFDIHSVTQSHTLASGSVERLNDLIDGLSEFGKTREGNVRFESTDIGSVIQDVLHMLHAQITETGAVVGTGSFPLLYANRQLLVRLFLNLVSNSIKYRDPNKPLEIYISPTYESADDIGISVRDTGLGIAPQYSEQVFQPLKRLHSKDEIEGSGLGLAICRRITAIHRGSLALDLNYSEGARFVIRLPKHHGVAFE